MATASSSSAYPRLKARIDALLADSLFPPSNAGIKIASLTKEEVLYELNPDLLFTPASNQKLFTAAAALASLGSCYEFQTTVSVDSSDPPRIMIRGSGDPLFSSEDIDSLATKLIPWLPQEKSWTIFGDVTQFDTAGWGQGWMWDDEPDPTAMFISPLSVNGNALKVRVTPGAANGESVTVSVTPPVRIVTVENTATTVADTARQQLVIDRIWDGNRNIVAVSGRMRVGDSIATERVSVRRPELYFLHLFAERLKRSGVPVSGVALGTMAPCVQRLVQSSHTLDSVVTHMNKMSDNLSAECILKTLGARSEGIPGTSAAGIRVMKGRLTFWGIDTSRLVLADGSGVSRYNLVSPAQITGLLESVSRDSAVFPVLWHSLPVAGRDGSLSGRMRGTPAENNLRAKTGTMTGASSLSGYVRTADGELLAFSILIQNYGTQARAYRQVQDRIGELLAGLRRADFTN